MSESANGLGVTIIGASGRSSMMFSYLHHRGETGFVTGVYDPIRSRCEYLIDRYGAGAARVYASLAEAIADPRGQVVFVAPVDCEHATPAVEALRAGKHVYCEKPLAITLADCDRVIRAADEADGVFYLGMNLRHGPVHEKLHEVVAGGALGRPLTIEANEYYSGGRTYFRRWNRLREFGGGLWVTKACHDFDVLNWLAGGRPTRVFASSSLSYYKPRADAAARCRDCAISGDCPDYVDADASSGSIMGNLARLTEAATGQPSDLCLFNAETDTFDNGIALVEYDNDVRATYTVNVVSARGTRQVRLMGTDGAVEGDMAEARVTVWKRHSGERTDYDLSDQVKSGHGGADDRIMADFFDCCRTGRRPRSGGADGRLSLAVGLAARQSCDTGEAIVLSEETG